MPQETVLFREALGDVLRQERVRRGLTLRELSGRARISLGYISEVERGQKEASSELLASLCDALEVTLSSVLRDVSDPSTRIARLTVAEGRALIASGAVTKGMIPKLEESFAALAEGVARIHIVGRLGPGDLLREARAPGSIGTVLVP